MKKITNTEMGTCIEHLTFLEWDVLIHGKVYELGVRASYASIARELKITVKHVRDLERSALKKIEAMRTLYPNRVKQITKK